MAVFNLKNIVMGAEQVSARVGRLQLTQGVLTLIQFTMCLCIFVFAFTESRQGEKVFRVILSGAVGIVSSLLGAWGAHTKSEFFTRVYFILQMWVLTTLTMYLYMAVDTERRTRRLCNPSAASFSNTKVDCTTKESNDSAKMFFGIFAALIALASSLVALDFNDALNDLAADEEGRGKAKARKRRVVLKIKNDNNKNNNNAPAAGSSNVGLLDSVDNGSVQSHRSCDEPVKDGEEKKND